MKKEFYTVTEIAKYFKLSAYTIRRYIKKGKLKSYRIAGAKRHLIPVSELKRIMEK